MKVLKLKTASLSTIVQAAKHALTNNGLIVYPTDTVYGIAADATNQKAVAKLRAFKGQRGNKPISIAVRDQAMAEAYVELNDTAKHLYEQFLPGPLTIISKIKDERLKMKDLAIGIASIDNTVGVRVIPHPLVQALFKSLNFPITATSANISNAANPRSLKQWLEQTPENKQELIDILIDAGELPYAEPSTIIDTSKEDTEIVRQGSIVIPARAGIQTKSFTSHSPEETKDIAKQLTSKLRKSNHELRTKAIIIALQGPLGAGKTVFTQGLALALGITEPLRSPTYTLVKEYKLSKQKLDNADSLSKSALSSRADLATARSQTIEGPRTSNVERRTLYHIDAWRLSSPEEFQDLGLDEMLKPRNIIVIEWPQRLNSLLPMLQKKTMFVLVTIEVESSKQRNITIADSKIR